MDKGFMHSVTVAIAAPDPEVMKAIRAQEKAIAEALAAQADALYEHTVNQAIFGTRFDPVRYEALARKAAVSWDTEDGLSDCEAKTTEDLIEQQKPDVSIVDAIEL